MMSLLGFHIKILHAFTNRHTEKFGYAVTLLNCNPGMMGSVFTPDFSGF